MLGEGNVLLMKWKGYEDSSERERGGIKERKDSTFQGGCDLGKERRKLGERAGFLEKITNVWLLLFTCFCFVQFWFLEVLRIKARSLCMLGNYSTTELQPQPVNSALYPWKEHSLGRW